MRLPALKAFRPSRPVRATGSRRSPSNSRRAVPWTAQRTMSATVSAGWRMICPKKCSRLKCARSMPMHRPFCFSWCRNRVGPGLNSATMSTAIWWTGSPPSMASRACLWAVKRDRQCVFGCSRTALRHWASRRLMWKMRCAARMSNCPPAAWSPPIKT